MEENKASMEKPYHFRIWVKSDTNMVFLQVYNYVLKKPTPQNKSLIRQTI